MFEKFKKNLEKFRELASEEKQTAESDAMMEEVRYESEKSESFESPKPESTS